MGGWSGRGEGKLVRMDWYPQDYLSDAKTQGLSLEQHGAYMLLLMLEWLDGPLPAEPERLRRMLRASDEEFARVWPVVEGLFAKDSQGRLVNRRLERERKAMAAFYEQKRRAAEAGAAARWGGPREPQKVEARGAPMGFAPAASPMPTAMPTASGWQPSRYAQQQQQQQRKQAADAAQCSNPAPQAAGSSAGFALEGPPAGALPLPPSGGGSFFNGTAAEFLEPPRQKPPASRAGPSDVDPETLIDRRTEAEKAAGRESLRALAQRFPKGQRPPRPAPSPEEPSRKARALPQPEELERRRLEGLRHLGIAPTQESGVVGHVGPQANTGTPPNTGSAGGPGSQEGGDHADLR